MQVPMQQLQQLLFAAQAGQKPGLPQGQPAALAQQMAAVFQFQQQQQATALKAAAAVLSGAQAMTSPRPVAAAMHGPDPSAKKAKKKKGPDQAVPDKVALTIPESPAFSALMELQRRVDWLIQVKRSEIMEAVQLPEHRKKRLRLYVSNTHAHQRPAADEARASAVEPPCWTLHVGGRLLDLEPLGGPDPAQAAAAAVASSSFPAVLPGPGLPGLNLPGPAPSQAAALSPPKLPTMFYFRRVEVWLDPALYPGEEGILVWEKAHHVGPFKDQLEIKRIGSKPCDATVTIHLDWQPQRFLLNPRLAQVLNIKYDTKARIIQLACLELRELRDAFLANIKRHRVQDQSQQLNLPMELAQVLGASSIKMSEVSASLAPFLTAMEPIVIKHTIRVDGPSPCFTAHCFDVDVEAPSSQPPDKVADFIEKITSNLEHEVEALDQKLLSTIQRINEHKRRRDMYLGFANSPADFVHAVAASQAREMRTGKNANGHDFEVERKSDFFRQPWAQEAVLKFMQTQQQKMQMQQQANALLKPAQRA